MNPICEAVPGTTPAPPNLPTPFLKAVGGLGKPPATMAAVLGRLEPTIMAAEPSEIFRLELFMPLRLTLLCLPLLIPL